MELYMFFAFLLFYVICTFLLKKSTNQKIWTSAFIISFVITAISILFVRNNQQDVMMDANQLNWYYFLYLFGMISVILGMFNLWMFRKPLWRVLFSKPDNIKDDV